MIPVKPDHFLHSFDRYPEGEKRFAALAAHAAFILNESRRAEEVHLATIRRFAEKLREASPDVRAAWEVFEEIQDLESDR